jgi:MFS transporter, FHS family, L-fucose permease
VFLVVAALIFFSNLPEVYEQDGADDTTVEENGLKGLLPYRHLLKGVVAQFFYVGAQVGVASFVIRFAQYSIAGLPEKQAANYLKMHLIGFMLGRFAGSAIMKRVAASRLLSLFGLSALACLAVVLLGTGLASVWALVLLGFFHSIMFPTIFALSIKHLGPHTKLGSSLLVMSIIGGAVFPAIMGFISDISNIRYAFVIPLACHLYVLYFSSRGYRPAVQPRLARLHSFAAEN